MARITAESLAEDIATILKDWADQSGVDLDAETTFEEAGVLSGETGIIVKVEGKEFQITVVRSK